MLAVPCPAPGAGDHAYESDPVPPLAVIVAAPLLPPLQLTLVIDTVLEVIAEGAVMLTVCVLVQELASVIVQV